MQWKKKINKTESNRKQLTLPTKIFTKIKFYCRIFIENFTENPKDSRHVPRTKTIKALVSVSAGLAHVTQSCPTLQSHGLWPSGLLHPWNSPGKNTAVGCHFLLQGISPTQGSNSDLLHILHWQDFLPLQHLGHIVSKSLPEKTRLLNIIQNWKGRNHVLFITESLLAIWCISKTSLWLTIFYLSELLYPSIFLNNEFKSWIDNLKLLSFHWASLWLRWWRICLHCRRPRFNPSIGKIPGEGNGNPLQYSWLENPMGREPDGLQSMGSQRIKHDWETNTHKLSLCPWKNTNYFWGWR